jgi:long-chain acyl-CoA synthetase
MRHPSTAGDNAQLKFANPELTTMQQLVLNNS